MLTTRQTLSSTAPAQSWAAFLQAMASAIDESTWTTVQSRTASMRRSLASVSVHSREPASGAALKRASGTKFLLCVFRPGRST